MDLPRDDKPRAPEPRKEEKRRRFQLVKLEERVAPRHNSDHSVYACGGRTYNRTCFTSW